MKKAIALILIGALCAALAACSSQDAESGKEGEARPKNTLTAAETTEAAATAAENDPYADVLEAYRNGIRSGFKPAEDYPEGGYVSNMVLEKTVTTLSFALIDLCQDGQPELFIINSSNKVDDTANQICFYDAWGCENGKPVRLFNANLNWKNSFSIHRDGTILFDSGSLSGAVFLYTLKPNSAQLSGRGVRTDAGIEFYAYESQAFNDKGKETRIKQSEYNAFYDEMEQYEKMTGIQWIPIS